MLSFGNLTKKLKISKKPEILSVIGLILLCILMALLSERFLTQNNILNILRQVSINGIIAVGMTFVILTAGIDLSVGSVMAYSGTLMAGAMVNLGFPPVLALAGALVVGGIWTAQRIIDFLCENATDHCYFGDDGDPPWAGPAVYRRVSVIRFASRLFIHWPWLCSGDPNAGHYYALCLFGRSRIIDHLPLGRYIYAIGGNEEAVRLSGIKVKKYKTLAYIFSGFTAAISGIVITSRLMSGQPMAGEGFELDAIASVVLGGTDINGGRGSILGTLIGALIMGVLSNGLNLLGVSPYVQRVFKGLIILFAIYFSSKKEN